jgi:porin
MPWWALIAMLALASPLAAQTIADPTAPPSAAKPAKPDQQPSPLTFTVAYTADALDNLSGGVSRGANYVDLLRLSAAYDGAVAGHDGLTALFSIEHFNGSNFTGDRIGGIQALSGSEAQPSALRLDEAWVQRELWGGAGAVKAGLIDINTTFDVQETAALFLNASHGLGPDLGDTGLNGPSDYPTTALAIASVYRPAPGWTAQLGLFDGVAGDPNHRRRFVAVQLSADDGALVIAQLEKRFGDTARVEAGAWTYTASFPSLGRPDVNGVPRRVGGNLVARFT